MQLDWITVAAQFINFLVLIWLLNRFLFRPVLAVMTNREELIDKQLEEASIKMGQADSVREEYQAAISTLDAEKTTILSAAVTQAKADEKKLLESTRMEINQRRDAWLESLAAEKQEIGDLFKQSIASTVQSICDSLLRRISNRGLNDQMIESFIDQFARLDSSAREILRKNQETITIVSAQQIKEDSRHLLTNALAEQFDNDPTIDYQIDEQLIAGLKLEIEDFELDWSLRNMLESLDAELSSAVENADANTH